MSGVLQAEQFCRLRTVALTSLSVQPFGLGVHVAVEMGRGGSKCLGFEIGVLRLLGPGSLLALGEHAAKVLMDK